MTMPFAIDQEAIIAFVKANQGMAPVVVFLLAMGETLLIVSIFIPSTILLFALGGLFAVSGVVLWPCLIAGGMGAALGFSISYLIGALLQGKILTIWPFCKYPDTLQKATAFSQRWGATGVMIGHFAGPLRPLIPVVAGITHMRPVPFMLANMAGGMAWTIAFLSPGYLLVSSETFKTSLESLKRFF
jgi:membrane protein DedA with SNARE-associated domain